MPYFKVNNNGLSHTYKITQVNSKPSHAREILQDIQEVISYHNSDLQTEKQRLQDLQDHVITIRDGYGKKVSQLSRIQRLFVHFFRPNISETAGKCLQAISHQQQIVDFIEASNCASTLECAKKFGYLGDDQAEAHHYMSQLVLFNPHFFKITGQNLYTINEKHHLEIKKYDPNILMSEAKRLRNDPAIQTLKKLGIISSEE